MDGDHISVRVHGVPHRIHVSKGTLHFGGGWLEVRPPGGNGVNFTGLAVRESDDIRERVSRLNALMDGNAKYQDAVVTMERLAGKDDA